MSTKIKDLVDIVPAVKLRTETPNGPEAALGAFLLTYELGDALTRVVERVATASAGPRNCLIVGSSGCGKSTLLAAACNLVESDRDAKLPHPRLCELRAEVGATRTHALRIAAPSEQRNLGRAIDRAIVALAETHGWPNTGLSEERPQLEVLAQIVASLPEGDRLLIAIDSLDTWLRSSGPLAYENLQSLVRLGELSRTLAVSTCAVAGSGVLSDDANAGDGRGWMAALHEDFQIEYLPAHVIRIATASQVLRKNARQRREILEVLGRLREKLPELNYSDEEFIDLYPLEVSTWTIGGHLHRWIPSFSFPEFAARAADSVKGRPGLSLFALNDMFAFYEAQLRRVDSLDPIFAVHDGLVAEALPRLAQSHRLWARLALQSIFMHTIAGISVDVITLTNSVLLYDLHGNGSSYVMMAAVLKQLEALGRGQVVATGEGASRRYSLVTGQREAVLARVDEMADSIADDDEIMWALLGFGRNVFADWPLSLATSRPGPSAGWELTQQPGAIMLRPDGDDRESGAKAARPRLVILAPGRSWSEGREVVTRLKNTVCWIGAAPIPAGVQVLKKWIATTRLADDERYNRFADLATLRREIEEQAASVFRRVYVERGTLITEHHSEQVEALVQTEREHNFVARFLPKDAVASAAAQDSASAASAIRSNVVANDDARWLACLTAATAEEAASLANVRDQASWLMRLETWYANGVTRNVVLPVSPSGSAAMQTPELAAAVEAKQQIDVALFTVRRALGSGTIANLRESLQPVFETPEALWTARTRLDWLESYVAWLATVDRAKRYLTEAEAVDDNDVEALKASLIEWANRLEGFVDERRRSAFSEAFATFRDEYIRYYAAEHNRAVCPEVVDRLTTAIIESPTWQALEALTALPIGNPSYIVEATNLISMLREARCDADVRLSLMEWPRCACGFRFGDRARIAALASSAADLIQSGIKHHRRLLQLRKSELRAKLKARKSAYSVEVIKTIAAISGDEDLPEIDNDTVSALTDLLAPRSV